MFNVQSSKSVRRLDHRSSRRLLRYVTKLVDAIILVKRSLTLLPRLHELGTAVELWTYLW